jgi:small subunit ribosomal protein S20
VANHKQAIKRHRQSQKRRARNRAVVSTLRGLVKKARSAIAAGAPGDKSVAEATQAFDRAVSKGVLHKRTASRRVSRLAKAANRAKAK